MITLNFMGERLGLALGTIALVSLFSPCVKLVELGKSYEYDYSLAYLKLSFAES